MPQSMFRITLYFTNSERLSFLIQTYGNMIIGSNVKCSPLNRLTAVDSLGQLPCTLLNSTPSFADLIFPIEKINSLWHRSIDCYGKTWTPIQCSPLHRTGPRFCLQERGAERRGAGTRPGHAALKSSRSVAVHWPRRREREQRSKERSEVERQ